MKKFIVGALVLSFVILPNVASANRFTDFWAGWFRINPQPELQNIERAINREQETSASTEVTAPMTAPPLTLVSPVGGEKFSFGGVLPIRWKGSTESEIVTIYLQSAKGDLCFIGYSDVKTQGISYNLIRNYTCPETSQTLAAGSYKIVIRDDGPTKKKNVSAQDTSDSFFTIDDKSIPTPTPSTPVNDPSTVTFPDIKAGYYIKSVAFKRNFKNTELVSFKNVKGIETTNGDSLPTPEEGFHVQASISEANNPNPKTDVVPNINTEYDQKTNSWSGTFRPTLPDGSYVLNITLYCSNHTKACFTTHGDNYEAEVLIPFRVGNAATEAPATPVSSESGSIKVFPIQEFWRIGNTYTINFSTAGNTKGPFSVYLEKYHEPQSGKTGVNSSMLIGETNSGSFSYTIPGSFNTFPGQGWTFKIKVCSSSCVILGHSNQFSIGPQLQVVYPNGGENLMNGSKVLIKWDKSNVPSPTIDISLLDDPSRYGDVIIKNTPNDGSEEWTVRSLTSIETKSGTTATPSGRYVIFVSCSDNNCIVDDSNRSFTISGAVPTPTSTPLPITVLSPRQGESWVVGNTYSISWTAFSASADTFVYLSGGGNEEGYYKYIGTPTGNNFSLNYTVQTSDVPQVVGATWKVAVCEGKMTSGGRNCGWSGEVKVTAAPPSTSSVNITFPNGGEVFNAGSSYFIKYYASGNNEKVRFSLVNTATRQSWWIGSDIPLQSNSLEGVVGWNIPDDVPAGDAYKVRIIRQSDNAMIEESDRPFRILGVQSGISITSVSANETHKAGTNMDISYDARNYAAGTTFDIKLAKRELVANSKIEPVSTIVYSLPSSGTYTWRIPENLAAANNYLILICPANSSTEKCANSLVFKVTPSSSATPSPTNTPYGTTSRVPSHNLMANTFYMLGDIFDLVF